MMDLNATQLIDITSEEEELAEEDGKRKVAELRVFKHKETEEVHYSVHAGRNLVGRDTRCDICIPVQAISKKHACIETSGGQFLLYDFASRNKTRKGKLILQAGVRYELKDGDQITFADVKSQFYKVEEDLNDTADLSGSETGSESMLPEELDNGSQPGFSAHGTDTGHNGSQEDDLDVAQSVLLMPTQKYLEENNADIVVNNAETDCPTLVADTDSETDIEENVVSCRPDTPQNDDNSLFMVKQTPGYLLKDSHRLCVNDSDPEQSPVPSDNARPSLVPGRQAVSRAESPSQVASTLVLGSFEATHEKAADSNTQNEGDFSHAKPLKTYKTLGNNVAVTSPLLESDDESEDLRRIDDALLSPAIACKSKKGNDERTRGNRHYGLGKVKFDTSVAKPNAGVDTAAISGKCEFLPDSEDIDDLDSTQAYGVDRFSLFHAITLAQDHSTSDPGDSDQKGSVSLTTIPVGGTAAVLGTVSASESPGHLAKAASLTESGKDGLDGMADTVAVTESTLPLTDSHPVTGAPGLDPNVTEHNTVDSGTLGDTLAIGDSVAVKESVFSATLVIADTAAIQDTAAVTDTEVIESTAPFVSSPIDTSRSRPLDVFDSEQVTISNHSGQKSHAHASFIKLQGAKDPNGKNWKTEKTRSENESCSNSLEKLDQVADPAWLDCPDAFSNEATQVYSYEPDDPNLALEASSADPASLDSLISKNESKKEKTHDDPVTISSNNGFPSCLVDVDNGRSEVENEATQAYGVEDDNLTQTEDEDVQLPAVPPLSATRHKVELKGPLFLTETIEKREKSVDPHNENIEATQVYCSDEVDYGEDVAVCDRQPARVRSTNDISEEGGANKTNSLLQKIERTGKNGGEANGVEVSRSSDILTPGQIGGKAEAGIFETEATQAYTLDDFELIQEEDREMKVEFTAEIKTTSLGEERDEEERLTHLDPSRQALEERTLSEMTDAEKCDETETVAGTEEKAQGLSMNVIESVSPGHSVIQAEFTEEDSGGGISLEGISCNNGESRKDKTGISPMVSVGDAKVTTRERRGRRLRSNKGKERSIRHHSTQDEESRTTKGKKESLVEMTTPDSARSESTDPELILPHSRSRVGSKSDKGMRVSQFKAEELGGNDKDQMEIFEQKGLPVERWDQVKGSPLKRRRSNRNNEKLTKEKNQELESAKAQNDENQEPDSAKVANDESQELKSTRHANDGDQKLESAKDENQEPDSAKAANDESQELKSTRHANDGDKKLESAKDENQGPDSAIAANDGNQELKSARHANDEDQKLDSAKDENQEPDCTKAAKDENKELENQQSYSVNRVSRRKTKGSDLPNQGTPASTVPGIRTSGRRRSSRRNAGKCRIQGDEAAEDTESDVKSSQGMLVENESYGESIVTGEDGRTSSKRTSREEREGTEGEQVPVVSVEEGFQVDDALNSSGPIENVREVEGDENSGRNNTEEVNTEVKVASLSIVKKVTRKRGSRRTEANVDAMNADDSPSVDLTKNADVITEERQGVSETSSSYKTHTKRNVIGRAVRQMDRTELCDIQTEPALVKDEEETLDTADLSGKSQELLNRVSEVKEETMMVKKGERQRARSAKQRKMEEQKELITLQTWTGDSAAMESGDPEEQQTALTENEPSPLGNTPKMEDADLSSTPDKNFGRKRGRTRSHAKCDVEDKDILPVVLNKKRRTASSASSKETDDCSRQVEAKRAPSLSRSPGLRAASSRQTPKVLFTGLTDHHIEEVAKDLGADLVDSPREATHLVTDKVRRTVKFLCCLGRGIPIVDTLWLTTCKQSGTFLATPQYIVEDKTAEMQYQFSLKRSISKAAESPLLSGYEVYVSRHVKPEPKQMKDIIECAGGKVLSRLPAKLRDDKTSLVIASEDDKKEIADAQKLGFPLYTNELLLTGILRQELDFDAHVLGATKLAEAETKTEHLHRSKRKRK